MTEDDPVGEELHECPCCGCLGTYTRTRPWNHDCSAFLDDDD